MAQQDEHARVNILHKTREQMVNYVSQEALETFFSIKQIIMAYIMGHGHH